MPLGWLPALNVANRTAPNLFKMASAKIDRQEFPLQRMRMFLGIVESG